VRRTVRQIDGDIAAGTFEYRRWFPRGRKAGLFAPPESNAPPLYAAYARRWLADKTARLGAGIRLASDRGQPTDSRLRRAPGFGHRRRGSRGIYRFAEARRRSHAAGTGHEGSAQAPSSSYQALEQARQHHRQSAAPTLDRAVSKGWLADNPARKIELLREDKAEIEPFSLDEVKRFITDGAQDDEQRRYFRIALFTGLRPGEQIGLQWDDIDWQRKIIAVRRSLGRFG
jgi:integrase